MNLEDNFIMWDHRAEFKSKFGDDASSSSITSSSSSDSDSSCSSSDSFKSSDLSKR